MAGIVRFGVSIAGSLLKDFDRLISQKGYRNRSEAIRDLIRDHLVKAEWSAGTQETVGTITLVYDHHTREIEDTLTALQHDFGAAIVCSTHVHLDHDHCLEVIVVRGRSHVVKAIADRLLSTRGVKHGGLTATAAEDAH